MQKEYALYKGEEMLAMGTIQEIATQQRVEKQTINYYRTQAYQNRLKRRNAQNGNVRILVPLEDD